LGCAKESQRELIKAAQKEGELIVYGSCDELYLEKACERFADLYGIHVSYQRLSTGEVQDIITADNGNPSADVWFGGTTDPYNECVAAGLLMPYEAQNADRLIGELYKDPNGYWYGIYQGLLGFIVNTSILEEHELEVPKDWDDLLRPEYRGLIWMSNPQTAGTAKLIINTMVQMKGHDEAMAYFKSLDTNIAKYTRSGAMPADAVGNDECAIAIGFLHDGVTQIIEGNKDIDLIIPASGTGYEIGATAIFKGSSHENAAKLWIEYALSPECISLARESNIYSFVVIDSMSQPKEAIEHGLTLDNIIEYDFEDAKHNTSIYVQDFFNTLGETVDERFKTQ
jgi:iron(III) transport system substrate-binding protein